MITKNVIKFVATCLMCITFSAQAIAVCTPALVVVGHAEDTSGNEYIPYGISNGGTKHAAAYQNNLAPLLEKYGYCPLKKFFTIDPYAVNSVPYLTAIGIALKYGNELIFKDRPESIIDGKVVIGTSLTPSYNWESTSFLKFLMDPGPSSTFVAFEEKAIWGYGNKPGLFKSILTNPETYLQLEHIGYPLPYNQVYVFTNQNTVNGKFESATAYLQLYDVYYGSKQFLKHCYFRIHSDMTGIILSDLVKIDLGSDYPEFTSKYKCEY